MRSPCPVLKLTHSPARVLTDSEIEDLEIKPTDLIILAARNEDDLSNLEVGEGSESEGAGE